jgi:hypothetical protein
MTLWIVLFSFLMPPPSLDADEGGSLKPDDPMRYRGIEKLLAKFEAEDDRPLGAPPVAAL